MLGVLVFSCGFPSFSPSSFTETQNVFFCYGSRRLDFLVDSSICCADGWLFCLSYDERKTYI